MKKLIEVALPLEAISREAAREKSIRHGHPSTLHLWWARRPLAACRAILFASLVDDPSGYIMDDQKAREERGRIFRLLERLVRWENSNNPKVLSEARLEIAKSIARSKGIPFPHSVTDLDVRTFLEEHSPTVVDPFCGGGSIPLEAQRLGIRSYGSDLNPVAVIITKALIEIPPRFSGTAPVHPGAQETLNAEPWSGTWGLAEDIGFYGKWMRDEAKKRIGYLYPKASLPPGLGGGKATVIAWIWARTVVCPSPACGAMTPLVHSLWLSRRKGSLAWLEPVVDKVERKVEFRVRTGQDGPPASPKRGKGANFNCLICGDPVDDQYTRSEALARGMGSQLMAIVAEGNEGRVYLSANQEHALAGEKAVPEWAPSEELPHNPRNVSPPLYGLSTFDSLFTPRQLVALTTFSDLLSELRVRIDTDAMKSPLIDDGVPLREGGSGARAYTEAITVYLAMAIDKAADRWSTISTWDSGRQTIRNTFSRQAIPMSWDYAECCPFSSSTGNWMAHVTWIQKVVAKLPFSVGSEAGQFDAATTVDGPDDPLICTDPPYYDNIVYADLSDFFYVWLRRSLKDVFPDLFSTVLTPKTQELVATPYRFEGDRERARQFFEEGLERAFEQMREKQSPNYPLTLYYAFKQSEIDKQHRDSVEESLPFSTGWEVMLNALMRAGFLVTGTWPMRTELGNRPTAIGTNALASSIVLVCRPRSEDAPLGTRREFVGALKEELPQALRRLQEGNIAPVDLAQSAIGPGIGIFSRYGKILEADGSAMTVRTALRLINKELDIFLRKAEAETDPDTQFCIAWFEQFSMGPGPFGEAEVLSKAKNTSMEGLTKAGVLTTKSGKVSLVPYDEYPDDWDPVKDSRLTLWECTHHLIKRYQEDGEAGAAKLVARLGLTRSDEAKALAYRLYSICDRKGWAEEALAYNELVSVWSEVGSKAAPLMGGGPQKTLKV